MACWNFGDALCSFGKKARSVYRARWAFICSQRWTAVGVPAPRVTAAPAAAAADAKATAKDAEPTTTKDPQIALDDLELLLAPMTKEETETEAKGWFALL